MAITNPFSIKFGDQEVGGSSSTFQLFGPYVIEKSYESFRLVFGVLVVASSFAGLQSSSDGLETAFRKRLTAGDTVEIDLGGSKWTYTVGETLLKATSSITKSGNDESDRGFSRAYTVSIAGELPADADDGLRDVEVLTDFTASRQKIVTMRGVYTATTAGNAKARYEADFDGEADTYLDAIDSAATWELVDETFTLDREKDGSASAAHLCSFTRQYVELLARQSQGTLDDPQIKDHRITFTDLSQHPGDSKKDIRRLRRVVGSYDCAVDVDVTTDLLGVYRNKVRDHIKELFRTNFNPQVFGLEDMRVSVDQTASRISVSFQFLYQAQGGEAIVEVAQSCAFRESRSIDYTPVHDDDELAFEADVGWAVVERVWSRTVIVMGTDIPKTRIIETPKAGPAGNFVDTIGGLQGPDNGATTKVQSEGWNTVASTSQVTPQWIGGGDVDEQVAVTVLTETVVQRYHRRPGRRTSSPVQGPITG